LSEQGASKKNCCYQKTTYSSHKNLSNRLRHFTEYFPSPSSCSILTPLIMDRPENITKTTAAKNITAKDIVVLISGRGSNLAALIRHQSLYRISAVLTNKSAAGGLNHAREHQIPHQAFDRESYPSLQDQKKALYQAVRNLKPDLIVLAGYMQIVEADFVREFKGKLINIHPSLLPDFPGLNTHRRALESGKKVHGTSVHFVDVEVDSGPVIAQAACQIDDTDTEESLEAKVLALEHKLYPWCIDQIVTEKISYENGRVVFDPCLEVPEGFQLPAPSTLLPD